MSESKKKTQQSRIAALLREAILTGKYHPTERLIEEELAAQFGVSRTPIRVAIRELEESGWVRTERNRGAVVVAVSPKNVADLFAVRANLESLAAREATKKATDIDIQKLETILKKMEDLGTDDNLALQELNLLFHKELCRLSDNDCLISVIEELWVRSKFFQRSVWYPPKRWKQSIRDHCAIVECLKKKDEKKVGELLLRHITYSIGLLSELERIYAR